MKVVGIYAVLLAFGIGCVHKGKRVVDRYDDGRVFAVCIYPNIADTATFELLNYHHNGKLFKKGEIKNGQYIGEKIIYFDNGKIYQIDSLSHPQPRNTEKWDGITVRYNRNGTLSQRFIVKDGSLNGLSKQYNSRGVLKKEYYLINDSIKNGVEEYFEDNGVVSMKTTYTNNIANGMVYYFDSINGDTTKYYYLRNNRLSYPYKQWLKDGGTVTGELEDSARKLVLWTWYDKDGKALKTRKGIGIKEGYYVP